MTTPNLKRYEQQAQERESRENAGRAALGGEDVTVTPSQAEGDRDTVERDLGDEGDDNFGMQGGGQGHVQPTPSQAEGDRTTIERDLSEDRRSDEE